MMRGSPAPRGCTCYWPAQQQLVSYWQQSATAKVSRGPFPNCLSIYLVENVKHEIKWALQFSNITASSSLKKEL